jgi:MFS family permease
LGGPLSGWILDHVHGFGLAGWRWLLILEALPAVVCGILTYQLLPDRPADAAFLTAEEKARLHESLAADAAAKPNGGELTLFKSLTHPRILHLVGTTPSLILRLVLWCAVAAGLVSYLGPFWACPGEFLQGRSAASALAFINSLGSLGSFFSLSVVGSIAKKTGSLEGGFRAISIALLLAASLMLAQRLYRGHAKALAA